MSGTKIVVDTDILSMFAKVGAMHMLGAFLGQGRIAMTPAIHDEITTPLQYGYTYPSEVLTQVPVVPLENPRRGKVEIGKILIHQITCGRPLTQVGQLWHDLLGQQRHRLHPAFLGLPLVRHG